MNQEAGSQQGFTLIEMIAVTAIISILAVGVLPMSQVVYKRAKELELRNSLRVIRSALDEHKKMADQGIIPVPAGGSGYPPSLEILVTGVDLKTADSRKKKFLRRLPADPMTRDGKWGLRSYADPPDATVWGGQDVYDVYSTSDRTAIDGSYYREW